MILLIVTIFMVSNGGYPIVISEGRQVDNNYYLEGYNPMISAYKKHILSKNIYYGKEENNQREFNTIKRCVTSQIGNSDLMNSSWPMGCHDAHRTGQSRYITTGTTFVEKWRFPADGWVYGSPVIDKNGTIYFGASNFYAVNCNGYFIWEYNHKGCTQSAPVIDDDGIIYVGTLGADPSDYLYAFYQNGTVKWKYATDYLGYIFSSPVVDENNSIYFGDCTGYINALYSSNGTLKWRYKTGDWVMSSPAIGSDGIVYCGSHDHNLYALYPNGTLKWQFPTGDWIRASPSIADDGTIYVGSYDDYLYALYPNGTLKWKLKAGYGCDSNPSIADDGTIYVGSDKLYAMNPDGTLKWSCDLGADRYIAFSCPAISADGTIFVGVCIGNGVGGELLAVNPDGTERWRSGSICNEGIWSSPAIAEDGTVYVGSLNDEEFHSGAVKPKGFIHAFGPGDVKKVRIEQPTAGMIYFRGKELFPSLLGKTIIIQNSTVQANATNLNELDHIGFFVDGNIQYNATEPPFAWNMNKDYYPKILSEHHRIRATAFYKGGCEWSCEQFVHYIHFRILQK